MRGGHRAAETPALLQRVARALEYFLPMHALCAQAGVTDNTPVHVLGGSVLPVGQPGSMTTAAARASPLTLLVALAPVNASRAQRCTGPCAVPQVHIPNIGSMMRRPHHMQPVCLGCLRAPMVGVATAHRKKKAYASMQ